MTDDLRFSFSFPFSHNTCITVPCYHFLYRTHVILEKQQCKHTTVCKAVGNCHAALRCGIQCKQPQPFNIPCVLRMPHRSVAWQITRGNCHKRPDGWASPSVMLYNVENQHFTPQNDSWRMKREEIFTCHHAEHRTTCLQKTVFCAAISHLLHGERPSFARQKAIFCTIVVRNIYK